MNGKNKVDRNIEELYNVVNECLKGLTAKIGLGAGGVFLDYKPRAIHFDGCRALNGFKEDVRRLFKDYMKEQNKNKEGND